MAPFLLRRLFSLDLFWPTHHMEVIIVAIIVSGAATYLFYIIHRMRAAQERIEEEKMGRLLLEKQSLEMNLRLLQAQIEPHFLFNTLSNVVSLIDTDPARGKAMLLDLTSYLRTSLSRTRPEQTTLAQETDMIRDYLNIQKVRMGERLRFTIEVPADLRAAPFPPMLLQPLVENAVRHGLEPKIEGGEITIRAVLENGALHVEVADTGMGLSSFEEGGVGIANVRERLRLLFADKGRLLIEENRPSGVRAVIEAPAHD
jgi:sensor histidine kinase YesM